MLLPVYKRMPLCFVEGKGAWLTDDQGDTYLDFVSGIAVNALGHAHPIMIEAIAEQAQKLFHISNLYYAENEKKITKLLIDNTAFDHVFYTNSGAEAVELAIKIAKKHGNSTQNGKNEIIYMENSFHGRTNGALSITGQEKYQKPFEPLLPNVKMIPFNDVDALKVAVSEKTCAVILEPIQGESGIRQVSDAFVKTARQLTEENGAFLIFDEIQCGMGRTGTLFMYEQLGVTPDIITIAKALGGGFPIGAVMTKDAASEVLTYGDHGSTYGGNPLACAVAYAVSNELIHGGVIKQVTSLGAYAQEQLKIVLSKYSAFKEIRGCGLLLGIAFDAKLIDAATIVNQAIKEKLLLVSAGDNVIRFFPPLNVTTDEIDEAIKRLDLALSSLLT